MTFPSDPVRRDSSSGRTYEVEVTGEKRRLPSVTTILGCIAKPALVAWAAKKAKEDTLEASADLYQDLAQAARLSTPMMRAAYLATLSARIGKVAAHKKEMERAAEIGTEAHRWIEWRQRQEIGQRVGKEPALGQPARLATLAWEDWRQSVGMKIIAIEQTVFSLARGYAGTLDLLAEIGGERCVIDYKTSKAIYGEAHLQTAMYRAALDEMGHGPVPRAYIVRLPKSELDPGFEVAESPSVPDLMSVCEAAIALYRWWSQEQTESRRKWEASRK